MSHQAHGGHSAGHRRTLNERNHRAGAGFASGVGRRLTARISAGMLLAVVMSGCSSDATESEEYQAVQADRDALSVQLVDSQRDLAGVLEQLDAKEGEIAGLDQAISDREDRLGRTEKALDEARQALDDESESTAALTASVRELEAQIETLESESWRQYCTEPQFPTHTLSVWRTNEVVVDGAPGGGNEWSEAIAVFLPLSTSGVLEPCRTSMTAWFMNDDTWLYGLFHVPWEGPVDPDDEGGIMLFRGEDCCGTDSDYGVVPSSKEGAFTGPWDAHGWNGQQWFGDLDTSPAGTTDIEGSGSYDGTGYWFEWRKRLDSQDPNDWSLEPGQTIANLSTGTWFLVHLWDNSEQLSYEHLVTMTLTSGPN